MWWVWAAVLVRLGLLWVPGHPTDLATFSAWATRLAEHGPWRFYTPGQFADYLPGYLLLLWPTGLSLRAWPHLGPVALKALPAAADLAVGWLLARLCGPAGRKAAGAYLLNPAVLVAGAGWGQAESVAVAWLLASAVAWQEGRPGWCGVWFALGCLTKPQYALAGGVLLLGLLRGRPAVRAVPGAVGGFLGAVVAGGLLFGLPPWGLVRLVASASATYPYGSVNALNLWYLLGWNWKPDAVPLLGLAAGLWGTLLAAVVCVWVAARAAGRGDVGSAGLAAAAVSAAVFALPTRMHERYLFPALPFALLSWCCGRTTRALPVGVSLVLLANLLYGWAYMSTFPQYPSPFWAAVWRALAPPTAQAFAALTVAVAVWAVLGVYRLSSDRSFHSSQKACSTTSGRPPLCRPHRRG